MVYQALQEIPMLAQSLKHWCNRNSIVFERDSKFQLHRIVTVQPWSSSMWPLKRWSKIEWLGRLNTVSPFQLGPSCFLLEMPQSFPLLLLLLSHFSCIQFCVTPKTSAHQAPPSLGFSRQEHQSGLPFLSPMHESEKWKWSHSVVFDS